MLLISLAATLFATNESDNITVSLPTPGPNADHITVSLPTLVEDAALELQPANPHMKAGGFYNNHSSWQAAAQEKMLDELVLAARTAALPMLLEDSTGNIVPTPFRIADLGCSQGKNSLRPVSLVIEHVRQRLQSIPITVLHADLPSNDFTALFNTLNMPNSYTASHQNVFPSAVGRSYYERLAPDNEFNLVMAFVTFQWLPKVPSFGQQAWHNDHPLTLPSTKAEVTQLASRYLADFLLQRAPEVVTQGKLLLSMVAADKTNGGCMGHGAESSGSMFDILDVILRELNEEGVTNDEERAAFNLALYCRTEEDVRSVLESDEIRQHYTVNKVQLDFIELPQQMQYKAGKISLKEAVEASVGSFQAVMEPSYLAPFQGNQRKSMVVQAEIRKRMLQKLLADSSVMRFAANHLFMSLTKK